MTRIAIPALALVAALGLAACEKASDAAPASQAHPTVTIVTAPRSGSPFAGATAHAGDDRVYAEYLDTEGNSMPFDTARAVALKTCELLDDGADPETVIRAGAIAARENDVDGEDAGEAMGAGVQVYCPEHAPEFFAVVDDMLATLGQ